MPDLELRPGWMPWALGIAEAVAKRADCSRAQVGAVIMTQDHRIVATGYNGAPRGAAGCLTAGACPRGKSAEPADTFNSYDVGPGACIAIHAEANAIIRASWEDMEDAILFVTQAPCGGCEKLINATPLAKVIWPGGFLFINTQ